MNNPFTGIFGFVLLAVTLTMAAFWILQLLKVFPILKTAQVSFRGIVKHFAYGQFKDSNLQVIKKFLLTSLIFWIIPSVWSAILFWKTDQSFLVFLFPIFWYFLVARFLVWEKKDILQKHARSKKKKNDKKIVSNK